jgi:hypothetical protein
MKCAISSTTLLKIWTTTVPSKTTISPLAQEYLITASTSQAPTNHAVSAAQATSETAFPTRHATTLAVRSRGPIEEDGTAVRRDSVFDKTTLQDRLSASAGHDQDSALDAYTDKDVTMSDE